MNVPILLRKTLIQDNEYYSSTIKEKVQINIIGIRG